MTGDCHNLVPPKNVNNNHQTLTASEDLLSNNLGQFGTILADPPWQFTNRTGKMAPEHKRLLRYPTMTLDDIMSLPVSELSLPQSHLYLWVPNALILEGLEVMKRWGFTYKTNLVWYKIRKDGGPDGRGVGFYFRNVTELVLFGTRGALRTKAPGRRQVNIVSSRKREHSRKPDELYDVIEKCSPGPYLELFARKSRQGWSQWGNEITTDVPKPDLWNQEETIKEIPSSTASLEVIQQYLGHTGTDTTYGYARISSLMQHKTMEK
ncbi:MAG TPA: MT-A70 family methyltransferase [Ktedonobacteraceae bacterium]|nr:MT-A70 family methyltransferase [Ktedonobacteraceae bacterium]